MNGRHASRGRCSQRVNQFHGFHLHDGTTLLHRIADRDVNKRDDAMQRRFDHVPAAILALSLNAASYLSENFRAGLLGVDQGQREAAASLGMGYAQALRRVILPQAVRIALPGVGNRLIALMKDTSLASVVTVVELTRVAERVGSATFRYMEMFLVVAAIYWAVNTLLAVGQEALERRLARAY